MSTETIGTEGEQTEDTEGTEQPTETQPSETQRPTGRRRGRPRKSDTPPNGQPTEGTTEGTEGTETPTPRRSTKQEDIEKISVDAINSAELAENISALLVRATAPQRVRTDQQLAMDAVALRAYRAWVSKNRPAAWGRLPAVTYFLNPDEVDHWKYLIRRACEIIEPVPFADKDGNEVSAPGVRVRFGTTVTLTPELAEKIGRPDDEGKTILSWAAVDKRGVAKDEDASQATPDEDEDDDEDADDDTEDEDSEQEG